MGGLGAAAHALSAWGSDSAPLPRVRAHAGLTVATPDRYRVGSMTTTTLPRYTCTRCAHQWVPRRDLPPRVCPKCKSPYWNRERREQGQEATAS